MTNLQAQARIGALITWVNSMDAGRMVGSFRKTFTARLRNISECLDEVDCTYDVEVHDILSGAIWGGEGSESSASSARDALASKGYRIVKASALQPANGPARA